MNIAQIENNLQVLVQSFDKNTHHDQFIYDLLLAYGKPKATIARLKNGDRNLSKLSNEIAWKTQLFYKTIAPNTEDLHTVIEQLKNTPQVTKLAPRFIIITDFETLLAIDCKTTDTLDIPLLMLAKHYDFFLPWAGMEKANHKNENPADVKAAEKMAKLFDAIKKDNPDDSPAFVHGLNVFLSRLLFCFFAEDTGIFKESLFVNSISSHTQVNGNDLNTYLDTLFQVMNTKDRDANLPEYLTLFPYVNGGLFRNHHPAPIFTRNSRQAIIDAGTLNWSEINPDIFGSMIQAVITPEHRGGLGMHYTSVPNIMKVIEPLFLNELYTAFEAAKENNKQLSALLSRIYNIKIFDPACGSGNFLIIAYKELRKLEMKIFKAQNSLALSNISLGNFYGIELDDFAHEVATLSLWLAEHQMNQLFFKEFGRTKPALPLMETGNIAHGNACRLDWESVCPKHTNDEIYILGNPPYLGSSLQSSDQKSDMSRVFTGIKDYKKLDYIACWFLKGAQYIQGEKARFAFVSTNSICQGEQVALLWPHIFTKPLEIGFAYPSFKWKNNARSNAGVAVVIIGIRNINNSNKFIYLNNNYKSVTNINAYLTFANNIIITNIKGMPLSALPKMIKGSSPGDGGNLLFDQNQYNILNSNYIHIKHLFKKYLGANEFIKDIKRYCLWITNESDIQLAYSIPELKTRFEKCKAFRLASNKEATRKKAVTPYEFDEKKYIEESAILVPQTGSEKRDYLPIGFIHSDTIISNAARVIYKPEVHLFSILSSRMHIVWVRAVAGRFKIDMQYSNTLCYNTFPFPPITDVQKAMLEKHAINVITARESYSEKTLAQLYDPDKMPDQLREAHHQLDLAVESCYRSKPFENDEERLAYLFKLYEEMIKSKN